MYFIPRAYPHHIENIGAEEIHFLIFFDQGNSEDIGYTGGLRAYSNEVLGRHSVAIRNSSKICRLTQKMR